MGCGASDARQDILDITMSNMRLKLDQLNLRRDESPNVAEAPQKQLQLEYVYGFRRSRFYAHKVLYYTSNPEEIIYVASNVVVIQNTVSNTQRFLGANGEFHKGEIMSIAISHDRKLVATGDSERDPTICIWNIASGELINKFTVENTQEVRFLAFNKDAKYLAVIDGKYDIRLFDMKGEFLAFLPLEDQAQDIAWSPIEDYFITVGRETVFWKFKDGILTRNKNSQRPGRCVTFHPGGKIYMGSSSAALIWENENSCKVVNSASGENDLIVVTENQVFMRNGGKIVKRDLEVKQGDQITFDDSVACMDAFEGKLIVGLENGTIYEFGGGSKKLILETHDTFISQAWGLDVDAKTGLVIVSSDDNLIQIWDPDTHERIAKANISDEPDTVTKIGKDIDTTGFPNEVSRAIGTNPKTGEVAVGLHNGAVNFYEGVKSIGTVKPKTIQTGFRVTAIHYSPDGSKVAIGTQAARIQIYNAKSKSHIKTLKGHVDDVSAIDWSDDSKYIRSEGKESLILIHHDVEKGNKIPNNSPSLKDIKWKTSYCRLIEEADGAFDRVNQGVRTTAIATNYANDLYVVAFAGGFLELFKNPIGIGAKSHAYSSHAYQVVNIRFSHDDKRVFTIGGTDNLVMQWKVI